MLTLYSYPELFGVADNNGYGLKVFAFLKLAGVPFTHEHVFDASAAHAAATASARTAQARPHVRNHGLDRLIRSANDSASHVSSRSS